MKKKQHFADLQRSGVKKLLLVMKLTAFLLFMSVMAIAAGTYGQETRFDLNVKDANVIQVFDEIERITEFGFLFKTDQLDLNHHFTLDIKSAGIEQILNKVLDKDQYKYTVIDRNIVIIKLGDNAIQDGKSKAITGKVTDQSGAPIPGASVVVKGTTTGVTTDNDGNFSLSLPSEAKTLIFAFVGMRTQEVELGTKSDYRITLSEEIIGLEEVVAIGYGTVKKSSLTGALSAIGGKELKDRPVSSISNALNGLAPGLSVINSTGVPGQSSAIRIRGVGTFNNTAPLYVIDGVIRDQAAMDAMDMNAISDISILKDAASAAVYGSRAGNGVILINTKQGTIQAPQITFKSSYGMESPTVDTKMMTAYENGLFINDMIYNMKNYDMVAAKLDPRYVTDAELEYLKTHDNQWLPYAWKNPLTLQSNLSINGGSEKIKYFMAVGYVKDKGGFEGVDYSKYNFQGNTTISINKNLTAKVNISADVRNANSVSFRFSDGADLADTYQLLRKWGGPWMPPYINGKPTWGGYANILEAMKNDYDRSNYNSMSGLLSLNYKVPGVEGLSLKGTYSYNYNNRLYKRFYQPTTSYKFRGGGDHGYIYDANSTITGSTTFAPYASPFVREGYTGNTYKQLNLQMDYARNFGKHAVNASLIYEESSLAYKNLEGQKNKLLTTAIDELFVGSADPAQTTFNGTNTGSKRLSYIGRFNYSFDDKYLLESSFRKDGSYIFAPGYQWGFFPSVSVGWRISKETFFKDNISFIDNLKLRTSFGLLGNDAVNPYQWQASYTTGNGPFFGAASNAITAGVVPNPNITWEKTQLFNLGIDASILSNSLDISLEYFSRYTYDMLFARTGTIPGTFGATLPKENYGKVQNNGIEVNIGYNGHANKVEYYVRGNIGYAKDKVEYIDVAANIPAYLNPIGLRLNTIKGYIADDMFRTQADFTTKLPLQGQIPALGMMAYKDLYGANGAAPDGIVNANDQVFISQNAVPLFNYGLTLGAKWNHFSIDLLIQGLAGWNKYLGPSVGESNAGNYAFWNDHWSPTNPNGTYPRAYLTDPTSNTGSTFWLKNASFIRLKNVSISYNVPSEFIVSQKLGLKSCRIYVNGSNLLLLYNAMKVIDPELNGIGSYPIMKDITAGIEITF